MNKRGHALSAVIAALLMTGCGQDEDKTALQTPPMPKVTVTKLEPADVSVTSIWPARVSALRTAQIRPQVGGIVTARLFAQGSDVKAGQALFQIDPAPFRADVEMAEASLARTEASYRQLNQRAHRLGQLQNTGAVSRQDYDDAMGNSAQAAASVAEAKASLSRKKLDLAYTTVRAPVSGRIDQEFITEGALVSAADTQAMATVQQTEQVYVDARLPASEMRKIIDGSSIKNEQHKSVQVSLLDDAGNPYNVAVRLLFSGVSVNNETGDVVLRAVAENPGRTLMPGMYIRVRMTLHIQDDGLVIPAQAVQRAGENSYVWIVGKNDAVLKRSVTFQGETGRGEIVQSGLLAGDQLVLEGQDKLQDGMQVTPVLLTPRT